MNQPAPNTTPDDSRQTRIPKTSALVTRLFRLSSDFPLDNRILETYIVSRLGGLSMTKTVWRLHDPRGRVKPVVFLNEETARRRERELADKEILSDTGLGFWAENESNWKDWHGDLPGVFPCDLIED